MVKVGNVRMVVNELHMAVRMRVRLHEGTREVVRMRVVLVVDVRVVVLERLVGVCVAVALADEQHDASGHEETGQDVRGLERVAEKGTAERSLPRDRASFAHAGLSKRSPSRAASGREGTLAAANCR
jgi:hypothetical protein